MERSAWIHVYFPKRVKGHVFPTELQSLGQTEILGSIIQPFQLTFIFYLTEDTNAHLVPYSHWGCASHKALLHRKRGILQVQNPIQMMNYLQCQRFARFPSLWANTIFFEPLIYSTE